MSGFFESLAPGLAAGASVAAGHQLAQDLKNTGTEAQTQMGALGAQLAEDTAFKGFGVVSGLGTSAVNPDGSTDLGVGPDAGLMAGADSNFQYANHSMANASNAAGALGGNPMYNTAAGSMANAASLVGSNSSNAAYGQAMSGIGNASAAMGAASSNPAYNQAMGGLGAASDLAGANSSNAMLGQASGFMQGSLAGVGANQKDSLHLSRHEMAQGVKGTGAREQEIYNRTMAMQQPGLDAQRAQQQAREYAMGRGGVRGSQFGGTAEDAAMAKAQAGAMNQASFQAMSQAQAEKMNNMQSASMLGQLGMQGQQAQAGVGQGLGALGAQNAQLGQSAAGLQGQLAGQQGQLGNQQAQLAQAAANAQANMANMQGQLGAQNAQLGQAAGGMLNQIGQAQGSLGQAEAGLAQQNAQIQGQMAQIANQMGISQEQLAYLPMDQQMQLMQVAQGNAGMAQSGQLTGAGYGAQLGLGGIQADINAQKAATELYGNMFDSILDNSGQVGAGLDDIFSQLPI